MLKKFTKSVLSTVSITCVLLLPLGVVYAAPPSTLRELINIFIGIINLLIPLIFVAVFAFMVWKLVDAWVLNAADEQKQTAGKSYLIAAVVALVLAISTWGIITLLRQSIFG
jgi:hypothetical protein